VHAATAFLHDGESVNAGMGTAHQFPQEYSHVELGVVTEVHSAVVFVDVVVTREEVLDADDVVVTRDDVLYADDVVALEDVLDADVGLDVVATDLDEVVEGLTTVEDTDVDLDVTDVKVDEV
jgi:hypothetical protein